MLQSSIQSITLTIHKRWIVLYKSVSSKGGGGFWIYHIRAGISIRGPTAVCIFEGSFTVWANSGQNSIAIHQRGIPRGSPFHVGQRFKTLFEAWEDHGVNLLHTPHESHKLNSIENLWRELKEIGREAKGKGWISQWNFAVLGYSWFYQVHRCQLFKENFRDTLKTHPFHAHDTPTLFFINTSIKLIVQFYFKLFSSTL